MEEKYGKNGQRENLDDVSSEDSEDLESEDSDGELATEALDAEITATLNAIRSKDPRVYNKDVTFYQSIAEEEGEEPADGEKKEKKMTLKDYHTKNLLEGKFDPEEDDVPVRTHQQEMEAVKQDALNAIKAAAGDDDEEEDDFLVAKSKPEKSQKKVKITEKDVEAADKDPETFLSNFLAARAWVPTDESHWKPLESDDEDELERAEEFENAYNTYFENPEGANERLVTYARDAVAKTTVRREEKSSRAKAREAARAKREAERREREADIARLRKLRVEELEDKVKQIRKLGGFTGRDFNVEEWADVLEGDWSDDKWDEEMRKRFGDAFYDQADEEMEGGSDAETRKADAKKPKKPKFDDDIDIKDIIPDFDDSEEKPALTLESSDEEDEAEGEDEDAMDVDEDGEPSSKSKSSKQRKQERADAKSAARRDRRLIEKLVDANLEFDAKLASTSKTGSAGGFRYRETSPTTFGLTPRDILLASDAQLNEFAGLKKLATFRDPVKKKKDKKHLSKKARLRQWRMDTFGDEEGPKGGFEVVLGEEAGPSTQGGREDKKGATAGEVDIREGEKKKKKRSRKRKAGESEI